MKTCCFLPKIHGGMSWLSCHSQNLAPSKIHRLLPQNSSFPLDFESTPPKTNVEPENGPLEKQIPVGNNHSSGSMLLFGGVSNCWKISKGPHLLPTNLKTSLTRTTSNSTRTWCCKSVMNGCKDFSTTGTKRSKTDTRICQTSLYLWSRLGDLHTSIWAKYKISPTEISPDLWWFPFQKAILLGAQA